MTATLDAAPSLASLTDDQLAAAWGEANAAGNTSDLAALEAEGYRRDRVKARADRKSNAEAQLKYEWYDAMHAQRMAAEAFCGGGGMLNHEGLARKVSEWDMWTGPWSTVQRYGSEDLLWFFEHKQPRLTWAEYKRQRNTAGRIQREQWRDRDEISDGGNDDDGMAGHEAGSLRRDETTPEAPESGPGLTVDSGRPAPLAGAEDSDRSEPASGGGAGGTVPPGRLGGGNGDDEPEDEGCEDADVIPLPVSGATILNDLVAFSKTTVAMSDEMHDAAALAAMVTHIPDSFTTLPRLAALSFEPQSGKSTLVNHFIMVVNNPWDPDPTSYALRAKFTERERPTPVFEEIHEYYGRGGNRSGNKDLNKILKMGYQRNAKLSRSVNGVSEDVSCFCVAILAGLRNAVPDEIYQRCIVWKMTGVGPGVKLRDTLDDDVQALGMIHGVRMHQWAKNNAGEVKHVFRNLRRVHPMLFSRLKQIWGPLFAVAQVAGEDWPARCLRAFKVMALDASDKPVLSPEQMVLRDAAAYFAETGEAKAFAASIREYMTDQDEPLYDKLSERGMALLMTDALGPAQSMTIGNGRAKGYHAGPVLKQWARVEAQLEPTVDDEPEEDEFDSLFDVEEVTEVTEVTDNSEPFPGTA